MVAGGADEGGVIPSEASDLLLPACREALVRLASRAQQEKPRNVGTPNIAGLYSLAGFDRSIRRHGVRGLIDFPYPCRTVTTQVLLYGERISCVQRPHNPRVDSNSRLAALPQRPAVTRPLYEHPFRKRAANMK